MTAGRPSKLLEPQLKQRLLQAIATGAAIEVACDFAGVDYSTVREWIRRGEGRDRRDAAPEYIEFTEEIKSATAQAEVKLVNSVYKASEKDWRAATWILERRYSDRWASTQRVRVEVEKELEKTLDFLAAQLPAETFSQVLKALSQQEAQLDS